MTNLSTTPGTLARSRAWMTKIVVALLAAAAVALAGATTAPDSPAAEPPAPRTYEVTADLDGRLAPTRSSPIPAVNFLEDGQRVPVECQTYGERLYGSRLWDLITSRGRTLYVPDRFIKTGTDGRAPEIRRCTSEDRVDTTPPGGIEPSG
jgi:peptidoglycan DL-endopeptidase RipA